MKSRTILCAVVTSACIASAPVAWAHPGHGNSSCFAAGFFHPLTGIDHILAMFAVGLCAAEMGRRALWLLPVTFLSLMLGGALLGASGGHLPLVEQGIAASVLVLGLLLTIKQRQLLLTTALVAIFAVFHGYAHGSEMQAGLSLTAYAGGFFIATALLHATGIVASVGLKRAPSTIYRRLSGAAIAMSGLVLFWIAQ